MTVLRSARVRSRDMKSAWTAVQNDSRLSTIRDTRSIATDGRREGVQIGFHPKAGAIPELHPAFHQTDRHDRFAQRVGVGIDLGPALRITTARQRVQGGGQSDASRQPVRTIGDPVFAGPGCNLQAPGDSAPLAHIGLNIAQPAAGDRTSERLQPAHVFARSNRHGAFGCELLPDGIRTVRGNRLLDPDRVEHRNVAHHGACLLGLPGLVCVAHERCVRANGIAHFGKVGQIAIATKSELELERPETDTPTFARHRPHVKIGRAHV